jgi:hypothetical protein
LAKQASAHEIHRLDSVAETMILVGVMAWQEGACRETENPKRMLDAVVQAIHFNRYIRTGVMAGGYLQVDETPEHHFVADMIPN